MSTQTVMASETQVRELMERYVQAVRDKDLKSLQACFDSQFRAFDLLPPLEYDKDITGYMSLWEECFSAMEGPIEYDFRDLRIQAGEDLAFCSSLNRMAGKMKNTESQTSEPWEVWLRATVCCRKMNGEWRIVHEHTSFPTDMQAGKACQDLKP